MAKTKISEFSSTPGNNTDIDSINIAENCAPSGINDAIRELMAQLKDWQSGTSNDPYVVGSSGSLTLSYGTANGVAYLNGSKVLTTGSALVFDGSNLGLGVTPSAWSAGFRAMQFSNQGVCVFGNTALSQAGIGSNGYYNGSNWIYNNSSTAGQYQIDGAVHKFFTAPSGTAGNAISFTQAMTLDASGNLGVGVTNPSAYGARLVSKGTTSGIFTDDTNYTFAIKSGGSGVSLIGGEAGNALALQAGGSERARITSGGDLLVNTTTSLGRVSFYNSGATNVGIETAGVAWAIINNHTNATTQYFTDFRYNGTTIGSIQGNNTATSYNTSSDYRLKDNPQPLTGSGAFIDALKPKTWNWKADGSRGVGFIAHEVQEVSLGSVVGEKDGEQMQAMEYGSAEFIANIIAELQSLRKRVAELEAR